MAFSVLVLGTKAVTQKMKVIVLPTREILLWNISNLTQFFQLILLENILMMV